MISVGRILEGAFGVFRDHFTAVAIWAAIYLAGNIATLLAMQPILSAAFAPDAAVSDPAQMVSAMTPIWVLNFLLGIVGTVLYTASMRSVLRPDSGGIAFLRLGMDELRTLGLLILFLIFGLILFVGASLILGLFIGGAAAGSESIALTMVVTVLVSLAAFSGLIYLLVRFSLAFPLTLHRRAFAIGEAWRLSRGNFWKLFGAGLVVTVIGFVLSIAVNVVAAGGYFADMIAAAGNPEAVALAAERQAAAMSGLSMLMILQAIGGAVIAAVWITLSGGSAATAARLLVQGEFDDAEDVFG